MERTSVDLVQLAGEEVPPEELEEVKAALESADPGSLPAELGVEVDENPAEQRQLDMRTLLGQMSMAERIKAAMFGNGIVRRILILDPSRMIQECVLNNPKLQLHEVEEFARNPNLSGQLLRSIGGRTQWMRSYKLKVGMVFNPKCPPDLSLRWLRFLHDHDVKSLSRSKNVPQVLQITAKKKLSDKK